MKTLDAAEAAKLVRDGDTVLVDGSGGGVNEPGAILAALEARFLSEGHPRDLTLIHVSGMGDGHGGGIDRFSHAGMVRRVIGGHWGWTDRMQKLAVDERIEAYCLPQGTLSHLLRDIAAGRPGHLSAVGLGTFVDPRLEGGKLNASAIDDLVEVLTLGGEDYLFTRSFPIDVAIIRGTRADARGNTTMDGEGLLAETLSAAQAAKNSGGVVLLQVREAVGAGELDPRDVKVPGVLVDAVVVDPDQRLSFATLDDPVLTGAQREDHTALQAMPMSLRKVIARRAAMEVHGDDVINLGFGMPDGVAAVLAEEGRADEVTFTVEQGHVGGVPAGGSNFGLCVNPEASLDAGHQFDWYDGGGLDVTVLSFAEIDSRGDVNVSKFGGRIPGIGGFVNISQGAKQIVFVGTFAAGGAVSLGATQSTDGEAPGPGIRVDSAGKAKLVPGVQQVSFSARQALKNGKPVTYVTERAVFRLTADGPELIEIAPGLDLETDVLAQMGFRPKISPELTLMPRAIFRDEPMHLTLKEKS
ncbi:acyl CoA:acetate/3-ketoacid CoA transferase [Propionicimonas sp. T2.31MG-18]|uniref:acyl CoA:acetate/3-ketoacid CoA transferase n=1 Tax=Propionicimonas sp. T2.31MG-18 TaxID=3157620 RepID=UPI003670DB86